MKIYTKTGDKGMTSLAIGGRVRKSCEQLEAYGTADELNSFVGCLRAKIGACDSGWGVLIDEQLSWIQNRLFDVGAILAGAHMEVPESAVSQLEQWIDDMQYQLPELREFILPGGSEEVACCHVCRTIARRLERAIIRWCDSDKKDFPNQVVIFVNRLSDYCFVLARWVAKEQKITPFVWKKM
ncbi:MAG: cob(I)yrinic acid a,c-diamide adenosyltransferase [Paludibacteraceae bacterium]|jgi:cob(I)alamin adenosyltransferase|nr:cob(I)yrinic acid a,c-diamide adenosyltransferase [Paludibacteraceae bacterium]